MRKLITAAFSQAILTFFLILTLSVVAGIQTAKAGEPLTVEGVWKITSSNYRDNDRGYTIARQGNGYAVIALNTERGGKQYHGVSDIYYGSSIEITATSTESFDALVQMFDGLNVPSLALRELAGKVTLRHRFKLSADGQTMEKTVDQLRVYYDPQTGRLDKYEIIPHGSKSTLVRVSEQTPTQKTITSAVAQVESRGEFYVLTKDGRKLSGKDANQVPLEEGTKVVTGSSGHVRMKLPDDTTFTAGPNSDIVIDSFVYDPDNTPKKVIADMSKGVFRWVTGKTKPLQDTEMKVKLPVMAVGIRGTDFEAVVKTDGSGSVVLHFGQLEITETKTGFKFIMDAGQKVTFKSDGTVSRPMKTD